MPYNIVIHKYKKFSVGPGTPLVNDWIFLPAPELVVNHVIGAEDNLTEVHINTFIKNYLLTGSYGKVVVRAKIITPTLTPSGILVWASISGAIPDETPAEPVSQFDKTGYEINAGNLNVTTNLNFQNLELLTAGTYYGAIEFSAYNASDGLSKPVKIGSVLYNYQLNVMLEAPITVNPTNLNFALLRNYELPNAQDLTITESGAWTLRLPKLFTASAAGVVDNSSLTETIITGVGNTTVSIGLTSNIHSYSGNLYEAQAVITNTKGSTLYVAVKVTILETDTFTVSPSELFFEAIKGFTEAASKSLNIAGFGAFTIQAPSWVTLSAYAGTHTATINVTPLSAENLSPSLYQGNILVITNTATYTIPVSYKVNGVINSSQDDGNINFTKDLEFINVQNQTRDLDNHIKLALQVKVFSYILNSETEYNFNYIYPFFNYSASIHIGEIIQRLLVKPKSLSDFLFETLASSSSISKVFNPAVVSAKVQIVNRNTTDVVVEDTLSNMLFVPGIKPIDFSNNACILRASSHLKRVTKTSVELLNFLVPEGVFQISIQKNTEEPQVIASQSTGTDKIFRYAFNFSDYERADVVTVHIQSNGKSYKQLYQLSPDDGFSDHSFHIAFINQHHVLELFEFTGALTLNSDIKKTTHTYYKNFVEVIEDLDSTDAQSLIINTGTIFRENVAIINAIIRSKVCWLMFNDKPAIELQALDKKLAYYDTDQDLYDYEVEFSINKKHDAEVHSF